VNDFIDPVEVLSVDRLVETYLMLENAVLLGADARALVGIDAHHDEHWISRDEADQKEYREAY